MYALKRNRTQKQSTLMALATNLTPDYLSSTSISILLSLLSLLLLISKRRKNENDLYKLPPGPPRIPIIGNLHQLSKTPQHSFYRLAQKYGPVMYLQLGNVPTIIVSSADAAKTVLKTYDLDSCSRPTSSTSATKVSYGHANMAFGLYGRQWRELRKSCIVEFFSTKKVEMFHSIREQEVELMICSIASRSGSVINVSEEVLTLANHITSRSALGRRYYNKESGEGSRLPEMTKEMQAVLGIMYFADYVPVLGWLDKFTGMRTRLEKIFTEFDDFYHLVIDEHMSKSGVKREEEDTLDALLRIQREGGNLTTEQVKGALTDILVGGSDTSSSTVEWTMTELMRNPKAMRKAQEEVRRLIGSKGKVEESDLPQLSYMKCVLKESMRLHPPAPLLVPRETMRDFKINGFDIPAKTRLIVNAWAIGRDESSWENPLEFKPERFIDSNIDLKGHDFQLIPFGAGRRICPGMHIGMAVVELALANLLYSFDWHMPEGISNEDIDMGEAPGITVHKEIGLQLVATKYIA